MYKLLLLKSGASSIMTGLNFDSEFQTSIPVVIGYNKYKLIIGIRTPEKLEPKE